MIVINNNIIAKTDADTRDENHHCLTNFLSRCKKTTSCKNTINAIAVDLPDSPTN